MLGGRVLGYCRAQAQPRVNRMAQQRDKLIAVVLDGIGFARQSQDYVFQMFDPCRTVRKTRFSLTAPSWVAAGGSLASLAASRNHGFKAIRPV
jgi:hypothetical protein